MGNCLDLRDSCMRKFLIILLFLMGSTAIGVQTCDDDFTVTGLITSEGLTAGAGLIQTTGNVTLNGAASKIDLSGASTGAGVLPVLLLSSKVTGTSETAGGYPSGFTKVAGQEIFSIAGAAASSVFAGGVTDDAYRRIRIEAAGIIKWGGGAATTDTYLERVNSAYMQLVGSDATLYRQVIRNSGAGDSALSFMGGASTKWSLGYDNTSGDFIVATGYSLVANKFSIDNTTGDVTIANDLNVSGLATSAGLTAGAGTIQTTGDIQTTGGEFIAYKDAGNYGKFYWNDSFDYAVIYSTTDIHNVANGDASNYTFWNDSGGYPQLGVHRGASNDPDLLVFSVAPSLLTVNGALTTTGLVTSAGLTADADGWMAEDNVAWKFGATATDLDISSNGEDGVIAVNAGLRLGGGTDNYVDVQPDGDVIFVGTAGLCYGSCSMYRGAWSQVAAQNTWYNVSDTDMIDGLFNNVTHDGDGELTVTKAGIYKITVSCDTECDAANKHIEIGFEVSNGGSAATEGIVCNETEFASEEDVLSTTALLDLAADATIELCVRTTDTGTPTITVDCVNLNCVQVGGT